MVPLADPVIHEGSFTRHTVDTSPTTIYQKKGEEIKKEQEINMKPHPPSSPLLLLSPIPFKETLRIRSLRQSQTRRELVTSSNHSAPGQLNFASSRVPSSHPLTPCVPASCDTSPITLSVLSPLFFSSLPLPLSLSPSRTLRSDHVNSVRPELRKKQVSCELING